MFLAMKEYVSWYRQWEFLRGILDLRNIAPIIAKVTENKASDDDLATVHLASIPRDMADELRRSFASHIARAFSPGSPKGSRCGSLGFSAGVRSRPRRRRNHKAGNGAGRTNRRKPNMTTNKKPAFEAFTVRDGGK